MLRIRVPLLAIVSVSAYARPISDVSAGSWTDQSGGTTNLYSVIDETSYSDADYVKSSDLTSGTDVLEVALTSLTDPVSSTGHIVRYRYRAQGAAAATMDLVVSLRQGASTTIATWTHTDIGTSYVDAVQTLSSGEANSITDYTDLRLRFVATY